MPFHHVTSLHVNMVVLYGDMYSMIGRGGYNKCEAVMCGGLLGCFSGTPGSFLGSTLIDAAGASSFSPPLTRVFSGSQYVYSTQVSETTAVNNLL